jgi:hypothetical protein
VLPIIPGGALTSLAVCSAVSEGVSAEEAVVGVEEVASVLSAELLGETDGVDSGMVLLVVSEVASAGTGVASSPHAVAASATLSP